MVYVTTTYDDQVFFKIPHGIINGIIDQGLQKEFVHHTTDEQVLYDGMYVYCLPEQVPAIISILQQIEGVHYHTQRCIDELIEKLPEAAEKIRIRKKYYL